LKGPLRERKKRSGVRQSEALRSGLIGSVGSPTFPSFFWIFSETKMMWCMVETQVIKKAEKRSGFNCYPPHPRDHPSKAPNQALSTPVREGAGALTENPLRSLLRPQTLLAHRRLWKRGRREPTHPCSKKRKESRQLESLVGILFPFWGNVKLAPLALKPSPRKPTQQKQSACLGRPNNPREKGEQGGLPRGELQRGGDFSAVVRENQPTALCGGCTTGAQGSLVTCCWTLVGRKVREGARLWTIHCT